MVKIFFFISLFALGHHISISQMQGKVIAVTMDDLPLNIAQRVSNDELRSIVKDLLRQVKAELIPITGFVNENKLETNGVRDPERAAVLRLWLDAGVELGNHTYAHKSENKVSVDESKEDILLGDRTIRELMKEKGKVPRYFRHPFLHTGRDSSTRAEISRFLDSLGYTAAPVTIDNAEWIFSAAFGAAYEKNDSALMEKVGEEYLTYMRAKMRYFEHLSDTLFGRQIPQILLIHSNRLNSRYFSALCAMIRTESFSFISLEDALRDTAYASPDRYFGAGGISWLDRWALTRGMRGAFFAGEPRTPTYIMELAGVIEE